MLFVGVDGCKAGWVSVAINEYADWEVNIFSSFNNLWEKYNGATHILVDIPIGLREKGKDERKCDKVARSLLGPKRGPSVFRTPCRSAVYMNSYEDASQINYLRTSKFLSKQTWAIIPKIREVDMFLQNKENAIDNVIREIHPEVCFWAFNNFKPMETPKNEYVGIKERISLLQSFYPNTTQIFDYTLNRFNRKQVKRDDILDALSGALTALIGKGTLDSIPEDPEYDTEGIRMEMVYPFFLKRNFAK